MSKTMDWDSLLHHAAWCTMECPCYNCARHRELIAEASQFRAAAQPIWSNDHATRIVDEDTAQWHESALAARELAAEKRNNAMPLASDAEVAEMLATEKECQCRMCSVERVERMAAAEVEAAAQQPAAEWYGEPVYPCDTAPVPGHPKLYQAYYTDREVAALRLDEDSDVRKRTPIASGVLDYFPDAIAAVAAVSHAGNEKHNPGEPLHWTRGKSNDHADCLQRHFVDRGGRDSAGVRHSAAMAWRALALLQEEIEDERGLPPSRGSR